jgi:hypothetical protein
MMTDMIQSVSTKADEIRTAIAFSIIAQLSNAIGTNVGKFP